MKLGEYFEDIDTIVSSSDASSTADEAKVAFQLEQATVGINLAAKCRQHSYLFQRPMLSEVKTELEGQGYTVEFWDRCARPGDISVISW